MLRKRLDLPGEHVLLYDSPWQEGARFRVEYDPRRQEEFQQYFTKLEQAGHTSWDRNYRRSKSLTRAFLRSPRCIWFPIIGMVGQGFGGQSVSSEIPAVLLYSWPMFIYSHSGD